MGIKLEEIGASFARVSMIVRSDMVNGQDTCHGRIIYMLADPAFADACNSDNRVSVAQRCSIAFLRPAFAGEVLVATAKQHTKVGRNGITDITVSRQDGDIIATYRGNSFTLREEVVEALTEAP